MAFGPKKTLQSRPFGGFLKRKILIAIWAALGACTGQVGEVPDHSGSLDGSRTDVPGALDATSDAISDVTRDTADTAGNPDVAGDVALDGAGDADTSVPLGPLVPTIEPGLAFGRTQLLTTPTSSAADLGDDQVVAASDSEVWLVDADSTTMLGAPPAAVLGAVSLAGVTLVATETLLTAEDAGALVESPLHAAVGSAPVKWMLQPSSGPEALWLVTDATLWWWSDGWLTGLEPIGLGATTLAATWGATYGNARSLWLGGVEELYAVYPDGEGWQATLERSDLTPQTLTADADGVLWVLDDEATLHRRTTDGMWRQVDLGGTLTHLTGHQDSPATWFLRDDGVLVRHQAGLWQSAVWADAAPSATSGGTLIVGTTSTTDLLAPLGFVNITGVPGGELRVPTVATIVVDDPARVDAIAADVDGTSLTVSSAPFTCTLDTNALAQGSHTLTVVVTYNDGAPSVTRTLDFLVGAPLSWETDIGPIYAAECTPCHDPATSSHPLHTAALWRAEVGKIYNAVDTGYMPLDPQPELTPSEVVLIKAWWDAGMPD